MLMIMIQIAMMLILAIVLQRTAKNAKPRNYEDLKLKEKATIKLIAKQKKAIEVAAMDTKGRALALAVKQPHPAIDPISSATNDPVAVPL